MNANEGDDYFKYGHFVKKITFDRDTQHSLQWSPPRGVQVDSLQYNDCMFDKDDFILLLEYLPNIQHLNLSSSEYVNKYLEQSRQPQVEHQFKNL